jgi:hypothetical protein
VTASTVLLPGVDRHGAGYRVRLRFGAQRHIETGIATPNEANARVITLRAMRDAGLTPAAAPLEQTLREAAEALVVRKRTTVVARRSGGCARAESSGGSAPRGRGGRASSPTCRCRFCAATASRTQSSRER